jgi:hypothetical protein
MGDTDENAHRPGTGHRRPEPPESTRKTEVSQVTGPSLLCAPRPTTPSGARRPRPVALAAPWPSGLHFPSAPRDNNLFEADTSARALACLRFNNHVAAEAARLAPEWSGSTLSDGTPTRWTTHRSFMSSSHLIPPRPALPGRNVQRLVSHPFVYIASAGLSSHERRPSR